MTIFQAFILGVVQGITEFLPISSSGHLVLTPYVLGWHFPAEEAFVFDVLVQIGTLVAVIVYFRRDLWAILSVTWSSIGKPEPMQKSEVRLGYHLIITTLPAVLLGLILKDEVEAAFSSPLFTVIALLVTAILLIFGEQMGKRRKEITAIRWIDALVIGLFQALALFPGISRSGSTMTGGMLRDLDRRSAARFSFLMAVPVMLGAGALAVIDLLAVPNLGAFILPMIVGFITAAIVGYLSIHWLLRFLSGNPLSYFSIYLIVITTLILVLR